MSEDKIFCKGGGCTAKLGPEVLDRILPLLPRKQDKDLLVGYDHADDAAIYRLTEDLAIVQTLDFFPPMVEDPHVFGQIAAANALSDIYAMGGTAKTALNIVCFPESMDLNDPGKNSYRGSRKGGGGGGRPGRGPFHSGCGYQIRPFCHRCDPSGSSAGESELPSRGYVDPHETFGCGYCLYGLPHEGCAGSGL